MIESGKTVRLTIAGLAFPAIFFALQAHTAAQPAKKDPTLCQLSKPEDTIQNCSALLDTKIYGGNALAEIYYGRGVAYSTLEKFEEAIADFSRMLALTPHDPRGLLYRGDAFARLQQNERALGDLNKAVELNVANAAIYHLRGRILVTIGQYGAALEDFDKALAARPNTLSLMFRSHAQAGLGRYDLAIADLDKALAMKPTGDAYRTLSALRCGTRAMIEEQMDEALAECQKNLRAESESADALDSVSFVYFRMGNFDQARKYNARAIAMTPDNYGLIFMRGAIKLQQGDTEGGNADIAAAKAADYYVAKFYALYGIRH